MEEDTKTNTEKEVKRDECLKGGNHEFETKQGGLGQTYQVCAKCGAGIPFSLHLGSH